ncbi:MAG TPA: SdrD B-like domain-containing protein [Burkholderiales bacterium]
MNNELGHIRALSPVEVASGYRIRLPTPLIEGAVVEASSSGLSLRFTSGSLGIYRGRTFPVFSSDGATGRIAGAAGSYRLDEHWSAGLQLWQLDGVTTGNGPRDFATWAGGLRYDGGAAGKAQVSLLANDFGASGFWVDGERSAGAWLHNAGVFRLGRDLEWVDAYSSIPNDIEGWYWRVATRTFHRTFSAGLDWSRTNTERDPTLPRRSSAAGFAAASYRLSADTNLSGSLTLGRDAIRGAGIDGESGTWSVRGSLSRRADSGTDVWALAAADRSGSSGYSRYDATWDRYWNRSVWFSSLRAGVALAAQTGSNEDFTQGTVRASGTWTFNRWRVSGHLSAGYYESDDSDNGRTIAVGLTVATEISRAWQIAADLNYNRNALTLLADGSEVRATDKHFLVSLRHDARWGRPEHPVGFVNGGYGRGSVRGVLFLDHNDNGVRDPEEPGVGGIVVFLDRGFSTETDAAGEFTFSPVASGEHRLSIDIANVPLPWVPVTEGPLPVHVVPRETTVVEIPLRRELP